MLKFYFDFNPTANRDVTEWSHNSLALMTVIIIIMSLEYLNKRYNWSLSQVRLDIKSQRVVWLTGIVKFLTEHKMNCNYIEAIGIWLKAILVYEMFTKYRAWITSLTLNSTKGKSCCLEQQRSVTNSNNGRGIVSCVHHLVGNDSNENRANIRLKTCRSYSAGIFSPFDCLDRDWWLEQTRYSGEWTPNEGNSNEIYAFLFHFYSAIP